MILDTIFSHKLYKRGEVLESYPIVFYNIVLMTPHSRLQYGTMHRLTLGSHSIYGTHANGVSNETAQCKGRFHVLLIFLKPCIVQKGKDISPIRYRYGIV